MEANDFMVKLKADGSRNDWTDLDEVFREYRAIYAKLTTKDRGPFALNVLCLLCRNLEKVPTWSKNVKNESLLAISVECAREACVLKGTDPVKALACVYHLHRHLVRLATPLSPELVLKLSNFPFDCENILTEYGKTYWNILADRITYIERLKANGTNIAKLLPKLTEDIIQVIKLYNTPQFCSTILMFLVKKIHILFSEFNVTELNRTYEKIFKALSSKDDIKSFKKLPDKEVFDIYIKLNESLYVIAENASKIDFKTAVLNTVVQTFILIIGHLPDLLHCVQNLYLNGICSILAENSNSCYTETVLNSLVISCETSEKLGYTKAMITTYPYINQLLRLYIEHKITRKDKNWTKIFPEPLQLASINLINFLIKKLQNCNQLLRCENCTIKSGLHDALRLSFLIKNFITISVEQKININSILPVYYSIIVQQYEILKQLCGLGCMNYEKCYRKLQSDIHNTAILLNKTQHYDYSIKLFDLYLRNEILHFKNETELKNISRALYNKSICELDAKQYENALSDAYLSLIFAYPDGLSSEKYMSLVMDIKAKELKSRPEDEPMEDLQMMTVLDACADAVEKKVYGNMRPFFCDLKFSELLKHEFSMYAKLWPSILPVGAVWRALWGLTAHDVPWTQATDDSVQSTLYSVVLQTPSAVRTVHSEHFADTVNEMLADFHSHPPTTVDQKIVYATLLFLKSEFSFAEASQKYGWKNTDPDQNGNRTLKQESDCLSPAVQAVLVWNDIANNIHSVQNKENLLYALRVAQVFVPNFLHLYRNVLGLQLAYTCCAVAVYLGDKSSYLQNASSILYLANKQTKQTAGIIQRGSQICSELIQREESQEVALVFLCDCAMYYKRIGQTSMAATLTRAVQAKMLSALENNPDINLDLALGHLLEAQYQLHKGDRPNMLTAAILSHRHYLTATNAATKWSTRRYRALSTKLGIQSTSKAALLLAKSLCLLKRAAGARLAAPSAGTLLAHAADPAATADTQTIIDNQLKYYIGVQPSTDQPVLPTFRHKTDEPSSPRLEIETMLDHMTFKKTQTSPSAPCLDVPGFRLPDFLTHDLKCQCLLCKNKVSFVIICMAFGLEASMYYRAKEFAIAQNYFDGVFKCISLAESRIKMSHCDAFEEFLVDISNDILYDDFCRIQIEILIEAVFFELAQENHKGADEKIVRIHEILQDYKNCSPYLKNEVLNVLATAAYIRKGTIKKTDQFNLEAEFENLKLSPAKVIPAPKTPESKAEKPPKIEKVKVSDEEIPKTKRRVIKLNLDENLDEKEAPTKRVSKRTAFKIPVPVTAKPVLESITPTPRRKKPEIIVTHADNPSSSILDFATPKPKNGDRSEFFTPAETPSDQFFTPMSTVKTYSKKTLRQDVIKNLEHEFSTPKSEIKTKNTDKPKDSANCKENVDTQNSKAKAKVETGSLKSLKDKRQQLKRATSPGKLEKVEKRPPPVRPSRLRQPVRLSLDEDDKK